jgi:ABC-2 type transport system ATP-binding protein
MIEIQGLAKSYDKGKVNAVDDLSLVVKTGEVFGFLGPNGAGKTTTIKLMVGLLRPDRGRVLLDGIDVHARPLEAKRLVGYAPDDALLYDKMRGIAFLTFIADVFGMPADRRGVIEDLAGELELTAALREPISSYSHGMRQKLSIISCLMHDPSIFVLDEPIVGLDPRAAFLLKEKMRDHARRGRTVFFSTHIMEVAERLCDRVGIINKGKMVAVGPLEELRAKAGEADATLEQLFLELTDAAGVEGGGEGSGGHAQAH